MTNDQGIFEDFKTSKMTNSEMAIFSDLPRDLVEEVLSRVPLTSLRIVLSTCKHWNDLSKDRSFTNKHIAKSKAAKRKKKESLAIMMIDFKVYLTSLNLPKFHKYNDIEAPIKLEGKLISLNDSDRIDISQVFFCAGLLLCVTENCNTRVVIWNPWCSQTRWIKVTTRNYHEWDTYALGYEPKSYRIRNYKVLRFLDDYSWNSDNQMCEFEMYSFKSNSWKVLDVNPDWYVGVFQRGVSLGGNTYWYAQEKRPIEGDGEVVGGVADFLFCFDFTTERFGPRLPLPFHSNNGAVVTLSSVGGKQLAVLYQRSGPPYVVRIWISSKIEPNAVSWRQLFIAVNIMKPLSSFQSDSNAGSFFVDDKKKVALVLDKEKESTRNVAYILGKKGYLKQVDLGECAKMDCFPLVFSYVPSSLRFKQAAREIKVNKTVDETTHVGG